MMQTSVLDRVEAGPVTVVPLVTGGDQHIFAHDIRTTVARILVGLPFALARLIEATSRSLASKEHQAAQVTAPLRLRDFHLRGWRAPLRK